MLGENGAGKSTLMKIIYGAVKPDAGQVRFDGRRCRSRNPQEARALGISMVFQHFSLFDTLTVAENVWLGLDKQPSLAEVTAHQQQGGRLRPDVDPRAPGAHPLSVGEMQRVEIIRALLTNPQLLILDEPTSVLTPQAVEQAVRGAAPAGRRGLQHPLHQPQAATRSASCAPPAPCCAAARSPACRPAPGEQRQPERLMIGAEPPALQHRAHAGRRGAGGRPVESCRATTLRHRPARASTEVRAGEVVGIAGVSGNGQKELLARCRARTGARRSGSIRPGRAGRRQPGPPAAAQGPALRAGERLGRGAVPTLSLAHNTAAHAPRRGRRGGWIRHRPAQRQAQPT